MKLLSNFLKHSFIAVVFILVFVLLFAMADSYFAFFGVMIAYIFFFAFTSVFKSILVNLLSFFATAVPSFVGGGVILAYLDNFLFVHLGHAGDLAAMLVLFTFITVSVKLLFDKLFILLRCEQNNSYMNEFFAELKDKFSNNNSGS